MGFGARSAGRGPLKSQTKIKVRTWGHGRMDAPAKRRVATEAELRAWVRLNVKF